MLKDGTYKTVPIYGSVNAIREIIIRDGIVIVSGSKFAFEQHDFFKVNKLSV